MSGVNYYQLLGLRATASDNEIRRAYLRLSLLYHPDKRRTPDADADELYRNIQEAYETLSCPEKRCLYDFVGCFAALAEVTASRPVAMPTFPNPRHQERRRAVATDHSTLNGLWSRSSSGETLQSWGGGSLGSAFRMSPSPSTDTNLSTSPAGIPTGSPAAGSGLVLVSRYRACARSALVNDRGATATSAPASTAGFRVNVDLGKSTTVHNAATSSGIPVPGAVHRPQALSPFHRLRIELRGDTRDSFPHRAIVTPELSLPDATESDSPASLPSSAVAGCTPYAKLAAAATAACGSSNFDVGGGGSSSPVTSPGTLLGKRRTPGANDTQLHPRPHSPHRCPVLQPQPPSQPGDPIAAAGGGGGSMCFNPPGGGRRPASADVYHRLLLTLEEIYSGCVKQLRLARRVYQPAATAGAGGLSSSPPTAADGVSLYKLGAAAEAGPQLAAAAAGGGACTSTSTSGRGATGSGTCAGWQCVEELFRVVVQPGWREGTKVTFPGKGDELPCGSRGDMVLVVAQAAHEQYERHGNDLHTVVIVPLVDALTGGDTAITTLDGRTIVLQLGPACLQPYSECVVKGEGMPIPLCKTARSTRTGSGGSSAAAAAAAVALPAAAAAARGDLRVRFEVSFPSDLTPEQKSELRRALLD